MWLWLASKHPKNCGSLYYNYKGFLSIILLALVDSDNKFIWADIGMNCSASDGQVFVDSELRDAIDDSVIGFPEPDSPSDDQDTQYFIIGGDAFPLRTWMMKPFGCHPELVMLHEELDVQRSL